MAKSRFGVMLLLALTLFASLTLIGGRAGAASTEAIPDNPALTDKFQINLGAYFFRTSTQASVTGPSGGVGAVVDFENTLGMDEKNVNGIASFLWRISDRWRLDVEYFKLDRTASRTLSTEVTWGDKVFPVGTTVNSEYNFSDFRVSGGYSFFKRRDKELGAGIGLHVAKIGASVEAAGSNAEGGDVTAPLPVLSLYGAFALTNEWATRFRMDWLSLTYGDYSGDLRSLAIDVLYQPWRNVGFGLGTRSLMLDLQIDRSSWQGRARTSFAGPTAFMTVSF